MARSNCPRPEALLAYQDAALEPHRQAEVAAHLRECLACRRYLREGNELGNFLRQHITPIDDPEARARLTARLSAGSPPTSVSVASSTIGRRWLLTAGLALVAVL